MGSTLFRDPQALSSALAALGMLQPRAFRSLNRVDPLDSVSNYYLLHKVWPNKSNISTVVTVTKQPSIDPNMSVVNNSWRSDC